MGHRDFCVRKCQPVIPDNQLARGFNPKVPRAWERSPLNTTLFLNICFPIFFPRIYLSIKNKNKSLNHLKRMQKFCHQNWSKN